MAAFDNHSAEKRRCYQQKKEALSCVFKQKMKDQKPTVSLQKNTSNLFRNRSQRKNKIDVRSFNQVLYVDRDNLLAEVEGMTTYEDLVNETLKYGCLPTVVPELKSITIGGALSGVGVESSSFRYGLVHETITEFEVLLGDGRVICCKPDNEHKDLFYAFPNSYGTLGYALKVMVRLIPIKKYIKLTHQHFSNPQQYYAELNRLCMINHVQGPIAYIEGSIFDKNDLTITQAEFIDEAPFVNNYHYMKIYYCSIQKKKTDYLTVLDYIWRWDPDWFWCSKFFLMQNPVLRFLLGKFMLKSSVYWKIKRLTHRNLIIKYLVKLFDKPSESVIQDVGIPIEDAPEFLDFFHNHIGIKPIWNCPIMAYSNDVRYSLFNVDPSQLYINFGFWDTVPSEKEDGYYNRLIERKVCELGGIKSLYSNSFYTEQEFWDIYDQPLYRSLKKKYDPNGVLSDLYTKCIER